MTSTPETSANPCDRPPTLLDRVAALATWLLEQITEDERRDERSDDGGWRPESWHTAQCAHYMGSQNEPCTCTVPARVLAECAAKRRIVHTLLAQAERGHTMDAWDTLRIMAEIYADRRPGYREEWRP